MNKALRYSFIAFVLLVVAILGAGIVYAGYCYAPGATSCPGGYSDEAQCKLLGGEDAIYADDKAYIPECVDVCCCSLTTSNYYYTIKAQCEGLFDTGEVGPWLDTGDSGSCNAYCNGAPACIADCTAINPTMVPCVGMNGLVSILLPFRLRCRGL